MSTIKLSPLEALLTKLEPLLPHGIYEEVTEFMSEQEEEIKHQKGKVKDLEDEVEELEDQVSDLERDASNTPDVYDLCAWVEGLSFQEQESILDSIEVPYIKLAHSYDIMVGIQAKQLEELIQRVGVEESVALLSNQTLV